MPEIELGQVYYDRDNGSYLAVTASLHGKWTIVRLFESLDEYDQHAWRLAYCDDRAGYVYYGVQLTRRWVMKSEFKDYDLVKK